MAKVIAAIVKFDADQTKKIVENEEQKLSLVSINKQFYMFKIYGHSFIRTHITNSTDIHDISYISFSFINISD